jgi:transposase
MWIENQMGKHPEVPLVVILEAAGMYHQAIINFLYDKGYSLYVVLPEKPGPEIPIPVPRSKAGRVEMAELVKTGLGGNLKKWEAPDSSMRKLKGLSQELIQRKKDLARATKRLKAKKGSRDPITTMIKRLENYTAFLEKQIAEINLDIKNLVEKDPELHKPIERISQTRGLDRITLATLVSETDGYV